MSDLIAHIFTPLTLARCVLPNRLLRSATYEGMADAQGYPQKALTTLYGNLVKKTPGTIITGFCAVSRQGRAMHPHQGGIWDDSFIAPWRTLTETVKQLSPESRLFMQLAHTGRQSRTEKTGQPLVGASSRRCSYFKQKVRALQNEEIEAIISDFAAAAWRAQQAGFDGVQIHAAHGYLIHQFLSPHTNTRQDRWRDGGLLLARVVQAIRTVCGESFSLLIKVSYADDRGLDSDTVIRALQPIENQLDAVEVSYGTMEYALNIIRGDCPIDAVLRVNPLFNRIPNVLKFLWKRCIYPFKRAAFKPFTSCYNLQGALRFKENLTIPVIPVGGIHSLQDIDVCLRQHHFAAVSLSRPFIREPDLLAKIKGGAWGQSACCRCNLCTIYCDSPEPLRCRGARISV